MTTKKQIAELIKHLQEGNYTEEQVINTIHYWIERAAPILIARCAKTDFAISVNDSIIEKEAKLYNARAIYGHFDGEDAGYHWKLGAEWVINLIEQPT